MEYVHLIGAEQIQNAAVSMKQSADTMIRAAIMIGEAVDRQTVLMDDFLARFTELLDGMDEEDDEEELT